MRAIGPGLAFSFILAGAGAAQPSEDIRWHLILAEGGGKIGRASQEIVQGPEGLQRIETQVVSLAEQDNPVMRVTTRTVRTEDLNGRVISLVTTSRMGRDRWRTEARIGEGQATVTRQTSSERRTLSLALPRDVRFDGGEALIASWDPAATPQLAFETFEADAMAVERVVIEVVAKTADGRITALRRRYQGQDLRGVARLTIEGGRIVSITQPMFGTSITITPADREMALRPHLPYRMLAHTMTKSPFRIPDSAAQGHIRYRFAFRDGLSFAPPQTGEQRVSVSAGAATVDICLTCGPGLATDEASLAEARRPTLWLQSDHPRLKAMAEPVVKLDISDARRMEMLTAKARGTLRRIEFNGHYSALETLKRRAGDCTEAAAVLAALGRAAGIPTRVVNGLAYSRAEYHGASNVFVPHSWVLAYVDGSWRSYDAGLGAFDSTHIALTVGDGDPRSMAAAAQLASLLQWEGLVEVRPRPRG